MYYSKKKTCEIEKWQNKYSSNIFLFQEPWKRQIEDESRMFLFPSDDNLLSNSGGRRRSHGYYSHHYQQQQQHLQPPPQNKAMKSNTNGGGGTVSRIFFLKKCNY